MFLDGTIFDSSTSFKYIHKNTDPTKRLIQGWEEGIEILRNGGSAAFLIPSAKAYGAEGRIPSIPPYSPLIFIIEVIDIK
jgi:FKBP-type peptidyl-prolyl cis-trans isomerase